MAHCAPERITSPHNRRVVAVRKLRLRKHRTRQGRFALEGLQAIHMALDAGHCPVEMLFCPELAATDAHRRALRYAHEHGVHLAQTTAEVMQSLSLRERAPGIVAVFPFWTCSLETPPAPLPALLLALDRIRKAANLGALIRTADAVGAAGVLLLPGCADPFDPHALRASMGSLFNLPVVRFDSTTQAVAWLRERQITLVAADPHDGHRYDAIRWPARTVVVLGNEGEGLSPHMRDATDSMVTIPMAGKAESLNVAVAGGILLYAWRASVERLYVDEHMAVGMDCLPRKGAVLPQPR